MSDLSKYHDIIARKKVLFEPHGIKIKESELIDGLFDYQAHCATFALNAGCSGLYLDTGMGKQQPVTEPVLTPTGWSVMGKLKPGDYVIGSTGLPTKVLGVFPQGAKPVFRLNLSDGTFARAGSEHLWAVRTKVQRYRGEGFFESHNKTDRGLNSSRLAASNILSC